MLRGNKESGQGLWLGANSSSVHTCLTRSPRLPLQSPAQDSTAFLTNEVTVALSGEPLISLLITP